MSDNRKVLYDKVSQKYDLGDFESFSAKMDDEENRKIFYDKVSKDYDLGDYDTFISKVSNQNPKGVHQTFTTEEGLPYESWTEKVQYTPEEEKAFEDRVKKFKKSNEPLNKDMKAFIESRPELGENVMHDWGQNNYNVAEPIKDEEGNEYYPLKPEKVARREYEHSITPVEEQLNNRLADNEKKLAEARKRSASERASKSNGGKKKYPGMLASVKERQETYDNNGVSPTRGEIANVDEEVGNLLAEQEYLKEAKKMAEAVKNDAGFFTGMKDAVDASYITFGASDKFNAERVTNIQNKLESGQALTQSEQDLLTSLGLNQMVVQQYNDELGRWYKAGMTTADMVPFMAEMAVNPSSGLGKSAAKFAAKKFGEKGAKAIAAKAISRIVGDVAGAAAMTATTGLASVEADALKRQQGYVTTELGEDGNIVGTGFEGGKDEDTAWREAFTSRAIENWSEMVGNYFAPVGKAVGKVSKKALDAMKLGKVNEFLANINNSQAAKLIDDFTEHTQWNGSIGEFAEEQVGMIADALLVGDTKWSDITDLDQQLDVALGVGVFGTALSLLRMTGYRTPKYRAKKAVLNADRSGLDAYGEELWGKVKEVVDISSDEELSGNLFTLMREIGANEQQQKTAFNYANAIKAQQAVNTIKEKEKIENPNDVSVQTESAYDDGLDADEPYLKHYAKIELDAAEMMLEEDAELKDIVMNGENNPAETINYLIDNGYSEEQVNMAKDYYIAAQRMNGVTDALIDRIDKQVADTNAEVDNNTNTDNGNVTQVVLRNGEVGYVVQGNVVQGEKNSVDVNASDKVVFVRMSDGHVSQMNPNKDIQGVVWVDTPQNLKEYNNTTLRQRLLDKEVAEVDWNPNTPNPKVGDTFEYEGQQVAVVGFNKEGMFVAPVEQYQEAVGDEKKMQKLQAQSSQMKPIPVSAYKEWASAQIDAQEAAVKAQQEGVVPSEPVGEQVNEGVNAEVNNPEVPMTPVEEAKPQEPVIPTKKDGSIDFVAYGSEGTLRTLAEKYGEKLPNKVAVTAKAYAEDLKKAQQKLQKAEEAYDNAPVGREGNAEKAVEKARQEIEAIQREADFWASLDAEVKKAQEEREAIVNPKLEVDMSQEPMSTDEFIAQQLAAGNITLIQDDFMRETGYGEEESKKMNGGANRLFQTKEQGGMSIEAAGERLMEMDRENGTNFFDQTDANAGRDALISFLGSVGSRKDINDYIKNRRAEQARKESEALREQIADDIWNNYHMTPEEYATMLEMERENNPFEGVATEEIDAIFAESEEEYQSYLKSLENGQGTTEEVAEGSGSVLSEEQTADTTGNQLGEGTEQDGGIGNRSESESETPQESTSGSRNRIGDVFDEARKIALKQKRQQIKERAKAWEKVGVKVRIIERVEDIENSDAIEAIRSGKIVPGWYESSTNEAFIFIPHVRGVKDADMTIIHEAISHRGLRELLGKDKFNELCDKVWEAMPKKSQKEYLSYPGVSSIKDETERERAAADEYIAHLAETQDLSPKEQSIWNKVVEWFKELFTSTDNKGKAQSILEGSRIGKNEISKLIRLSYAEYLKNGASESAVGGEGTRFMVRHKDSEQRKSKIESNNIMDEAVSYVTGLDMKSAKQIRLDREQKRKEDAAEIYQSVLNNNFDAVTLQKIDKYIEDATPFNSFGQRISQRLPQSMERSLREGARTNAVDALFSRISESAVPTSRRASEAGRREIEERKKEALKNWAIATNNWYTDLSSFTDEKEPFGEGTDSKVYAAKDDGYVIKTSFGKPFGKRFRPDIDNIALFNRIFPNSSYEIVGYGEFDGKFARILKQPVVYFADKTALNAKEREEYMRTLGFKPINDTKTAFSNGIIIAADLQKSNILKDAAGNISVIDADMKLHTKDVGGNYTYPPVEDDLPKGTRLRTVYHGSGAEFDKFNHSFMGTGEGAQAFGWGTYVTEVDGIARHYADVASANNLFNSENDFEDVKNMPREEVASIMIKKEMLSNGRSFEKAKEYVEANFEGTMEDSEFGEDIRQLAKELTEATKTIKESDLENVSVGRHLYSVDIPDNNGSNYLEWNKDYSEKEVADIVKRINDAAGEEFDADYFMDKLEQYEESYNVTGEGIYRLVSKYGFDGNDKAASLLLNDAGFVGMEYPAEAKTGGRADNAKNYVIFNEHDLDIVEHTRFRAVERIDENVGEVDAQKGDVRFAVRDILKGDEKEQAIKDLMEVTGRSRRVVEKWIKAEESLAKVILAEDNVGILDMEADESVPSIWKNSDYPQGTVEFSNICKKRLPFTSIYQRLQKEFPNTLFDAQTLNTIRNTMKEMGEDVACALCFVEDRRQLLGEIGQGFIDAVSGKDVELNDNQKAALDKLRESGDKYIPNLFDIITLDGMKELRKKHPAVAQAFIEYNNARGMQSGRLFQAYSAYNREILKYNKKKVESINNNGGLRIFSFSDFEAHHLIDLVQVLTDCAAKGIKVQGYTKVPAFAKAVKDTGAKINRSLIAKGVGYVDADYVPKDGEAVSPNVINGKRLLFDTIEGIDVNDPNFFDSTNSKSVGNILVAINDEHARIAMADPFVDYIIGFHTGQSKAILKGKGIDAWVNYKNEQLDKTIVTDEKGNQKIKNAPHHGLNIYTDVLNAAEAEGNPIRTAKQFTERFLEECNKRGYIPRFYRFLNRAKDGRFLYTPGYHKFLLDFKLFDKNGRILPQEAVVPVFDNEFNKQILDDYVKGVKEEMPNDAVYEAVKEAVGLGEGNRFRVTPEDDKAYLDAVESGDMGTAQRMVDEVLENAGYTIRGEHGTTHKFTIFSNVNANIENSFGKGFYFTSDINDAETNYASDDGADLTNRIELLAERMEYEDGYEDMDYDERLAEARNRLSGGENLVISAAIRMDNPCIFSYDPDGVYKETVFDVEESYDEETDEYGEPKGLLVDFVESLNNVLASGEYWGADRVDAYELIYDGEYTADQLKKKMDEMLMDISDEDGNMASSEIFRAALEDMGFDGIIDNAPYLRFQNMGLSRNTKHYIAFQPNQVKQSDAVTYDNDGNVIPLSKRADKANDDIRFRMSEPAIDYASQEEEIVNVPSGKVKYTMNNIGNELYKVSGNYLRELYKDGTLGKVLHGEYAEIDQIKAKEDYDKAKEYLGEYLNELKFMKYEATEAAQNVINDVISDVEYSLDYYRDLALGKDVWRTKESPRFRIVEKHNEDVQKEVDKYMSEYNSKPVSIVEASMTDEELEDIFGGNYSANDIRGYIEYSKTLGGYVETLDKILIFADKIQPTKVKELMFHENIHGLIANGAHKELVDRFYSKAKDAESMSKWKKFSDREETPDNERAEEFFAYAIADAQMRDNFDDVFGYLASEEQSELKELLNQNGYDYDVRRNRHAYDSEGKNGNVRKSGNLDVSQEAGQEAGAGTSRNVSEGNGEEKREQAERLKNLFDQVADMGLDGVLGNEAYNSTMIKVYAALPDDARKEIINNSFEHYSGDYIPATSDYLIGAKTDVFDKVIGFIKDALRKMGFDVNLTPSDVKYLMWRSRKPLNRNNVFDMAEDIDVKRRMGVEDGNTSSTRFRVTKDSKGKELSEKQKTFFANSQVVDENGNLLVLYHGSGENDFNTFKYGDVGYHFGSYDQAMMRNYMTVDHEGIIKEFYLNITNPLYIDGDARDWHGNGLAEFLLTDGEKVNPFKTEEDLAKLKEIHEMLPDDSNEAMRELVKSKGYDGIVYKNDVEVSPDDDKNLSYIAFEPEQIKLTNNTDPTNDNDIRFRITNFDPSDKRDALIKEYDSYLKTGKFNFIEAFQDKMYSLKVLMDKIVEATGKAVRDFEDAYTAENQLGSINKPMMGKYLDKFYKPLLEEVKKLSDKYGREMVERYIYCKSGLERNEVLRQRDADEAYNSSKAELDEKLAKNEIDQAQYNTLLAQVDAQRQKTLSEDVDYSGIRGMLYNVKAQQINDDYESGKIDKATRDQQLAKLEANKKNEVKDWKDFAEKQVAALEGKASTKELDALWNKINAATNETLRMDYESGMIDKETYDAEKNMMKYYVPLRNWDDTTAEEMYEYRSELVRPVSSNQKRAKGRESQADNPIATIGLMAQNAIVRGNRNMMKQKFYAFVANRETSLATVRDVWYVKNALGDWEAQYADTSSAKNSAEFDAIMQQFEEDMEQLEAQGNAFRGKLPMGMKFRASGRQKQSHVVPVMINGKEYAVYVNGNPRAAQAINGETNAEAFNEKWEWYDKLKRMYGAGLTSWSPDFIIPNMVRDGIHATTMTFIDAGPLAAAKFALNGPRAFAQVYAMITGQGKGFVDPKYQAYFEEFVANGGETGYTAIHTLEDYKKKYDKLINKAKGIKASNWAKDGFSAIGGLLETANRIFEDVNRFNAYVSARESGESIMRSVNAAKNITVNFNRKGAGFANNSAWGTVAGWMSKWILFFNPAVQGIEQLITKSKANPKRAKATAATILSSGFLTPMLNEILIAALGDDEEEDNYWNQSDYKRRNNWMLFTGNGYVTIPLPPVLRELYGMGDILYGAITGHITPQRAAMDVARQVQSAIGFFNLIPEVSQEPDMVTYVKGFAPDLFAPALDIVSNTNFMGRPIAKWSDYNKYDPEYERVYKGTSKHWVELSKLLNEIGGNEGRRSDTWGNFINPAMMEHLITSYTGGIGKTINNLAGMATDWVMDDTENIDPFRKSPILPRFYTPVDEKSVVPGINRTFYEFSNQYNIAKKALKNYKDGIESNEHPEYKKYIDEMKENGEMKFMDYFEKVNKEIKKLEKEREEYPNNKKAIDEKIIDLKAKASVKSREILK